MATIQRSLSSKVNANGNSEIMLRLSVSKNNKIRLKSGLFISPASFKDGAFVKKNANLTTLEEIRSIEDNLISLERFLVGLGEQYSADVLTKDFVTAQLDQWKNPSAPESETKEEPFRDRKLFPFISDQRYNDAIKEIFEAAGITRLVTRLNPTTGEEEKVPINTIASSHMARRTFIGNLYNKVQDPNLIGSMSGHAEGSRAFARYRKIDDIRKQQVIDQSGF